MLASRCKTLQNGVLVLFRLAEERQRWRQRKMVLWQRQRCGPTSSFNACEQIYIYIWVSKLRRPWWQWAIFKLTVFVSVSVCFIICYNGWPLCVCVRVACTHSFHYYYYGCAACRDGALFVCVCCILHCSHEKTFIFRRQNRVRTRYENSTRTRARSSMTSGNRAHKNRIWCSDFCHYILLVILPQHQHRPFIFSLASPASPAHIFPEKYTRLPGITGTYGHKVARL